MNGYTHTAHAMPNMRCVLSLSYQLARMNAYISLCIGVRNYQVIDKSEVTTSTGSTKKVSESQLVEIGPRFVLIPIRIFNGSLGGATLYQNPAFVSPNEERSLLKRGKGDRYVSRTTHNMMREKFVEENRVPRDVLSNKSVFSD